MRLENLKKCKYGLTHAGTFHADDVFAAAFIKIINPDIKILRESEVPSDFEGIVFDNYFHELITALVGPYISSKHSKIETVGTVCNLEKQVADMPIKFCVAFKHYHKGHNKQDVYGTFPHFVFEYENIKDYSNYEFYIFYFEENNDSHCGLIHVALIEGNIIVDMNGNTYKIVGSTKITCS